MSRADRLLKGGDLLVLLLLIRLLHGVQRILLVLDGLLGLGLAQLLLKLRHLLFQLDLLRLRVSAVVQRQGVDAGLQVGDLLDLVGNLILVIRLILGGFERLLLELDELCILFC